MYNLFFLIVTVHIFFIYKNMFYMIKLASMSDIYFVKRVWKVKHEPVGVLN